MLVYFRYFVFFSFFITTGVAFLLGQFLQGYATRVFVRDPSVGNAEFFTNMITENLVCKYSYIFTGSHIPSAEESTKFKTYVQVLLNLTPYEKVTLYNLKTLPVSSTKEDDFVFFDEEPGVSYVNEALNGVRNAEVKLSGVNKRSPAAGAEKRTETAPSAKTYRFHYVAPLYTKSCLSDKSSLNPAPVGAVEFFSDVDAPRQLIVRFSMGLTGSVVVIFCLFLSALYVSSRRHENIINKQHEEKSELERAKAVAENKSQEKSMFLANITHELRTPLNAIIGFSEILKEDVIEPGKNPKYKEYIRDIYSSGVHLLGLINDILDYSKAEASKLEVDKIDLDLRKIALSCMRLVEQKAADGQITLIADIPDKQLIMKGDPKRIKQVILNLLSNAVKFTPPEGEVTLSITEELTEERIVVNVVDTGIGIPKKLISKALSPFGQIDSSMSRNHEGTGLGLPLTKKLTEIMGGEFLFQSEKDLGTTVTLRFPYRAADIDKHAVEF